MNTQSQQDRPLPFAELLNIAPSRHFVIRMSPSELVTLREARRILEVANDAGKKHFGDDEFCDIDDNWSRAEHGLAELLDGNEKGEWSYTE